MRSPTMRTSAARAGAPVPSSTRALRMSVDVGAGLCAAAANIRATATIPPVLLVPPMALWQREDDERIGRDDADVLLAVPAAIRQRIRIAAALEARHPQLPARPRLERAEAVVVGRRDEYEPAPGNDRPCKRGPTRVLPAGWQL